MLSVIGPTGAGKSSVRGLILFPTTITNLTC
jgi:hypothetical protein